MRRFILYLARWQLSTPILWLVVSQLGAGLQATVIANLVGASIFFWVDRFIFRAGVHVVWEVLPETACSECGTTGTAHRLVLAPAGKGSAGAYDRRADPHPQFRCAACSAQKLLRLRATERIAAIPGLQ